MAKLNTIFSFLFFILFISNALSQNIPTNFSILNDYLRREQVIGNVNRDFSFNVRPINVEFAFKEFESPFLTDSTRGYETKLSLPQSRSGKFKLSALPLQLTTVYNSTLPGGWTNGALIPAKGIQTVASAGVHMKLGKLSIQLYPQYHYAQNAAFEEYPEDAPESYFVYLGRSAYDIDNPTRFGTSSISEFSLGNSHIMMNFDGISFGFSSENLWSGPGQFNSLVLSDNAPGFYHFRVQTNRPLKTFLGSFEGNYWIGQLKGSELTHFSDGAHTALLDGANETSWRYFTGITVSYSPKWTPGFSLGMTRGFQIYREDMENSFRGFFPIFAPFPKEGEGEIENIERREDQNVSIFSRYVIPKAKTEIYFEYSRNDHPLSWRELLLNPEHSRAFLLGFSKYISLPNSSLLGIQGEMSQTQFSINNIIRWGNGIPNRGRGSYDNYQVKHGWTNRGQILGANTGISGNLYSLKIGNYTGLKEISAKLERAEHHPNFYRYAKSAGLHVKPWIDNTLYINYSNNFKNLLFKSSLGFTQSLNYNFWSTENNIFHSTENKLFNLSLNMSLIYLL
ncbi:Capsule assembly protein Wzi [Algoriphagus winogradskyi]|uniref:Capsule assembly protein Wzi n=1 Tax=Algoriphagus winogradskyi TaxID=237017 RepID=A0ABY1PFP6_9BACT|nr:Capsule assembly protein Wzi [Algoriphagus winogradskyi]